MEAWQITHTPLGHQYTPQSLLSACHCIYGCMLKRCYHQRRWKRIRTVPSFILFFLLFVFCSVFSCLPSWCHKKQINMINYCVVVLVDDAWEEGGAQTRFCSPCAEHGHQIMFHGGQRHMLINLIWKYWVKDNWSDRPLWLNLQTEKKQIMVIFTYRASNNALLTIITLQHHV